MPLNQIGGGGNYNGLRIVRLHTISAGITSHPAALLHLPDCVLQEIHGGPPGPWAGR